MRINLVLGFFNPFPARQGGGVERMWGLLGEEFARQGHTVTVISRTWPGLADEEFVSGVRHQRLPGFAHKRQLWKNLILDLLWSQRVARKLPEADITITNSIFFPWLASRLVHAGAVIVNLNRRPRGQLSLYGRVAGVQAPSPAVLTEALRQAPAALQDKLRMIPNTADLSKLLEISRSEKSQTPLLIGFIGRLHSEKGVHLLVAAAQKLAQRTGLPDWKLRLTGPIEIAQGGGGPTYLDQLENLGADLIKTGHLEITGPEFTPEGLIQSYATLDLFVYPSLADRGETFGIGVLEAMAAGLPTIVSALECFQSLTGNGKAAEVFDHHSADAANLLADKLAKLLNDSEIRNKLAAVGRAEAFRYTLPQVAQMHLDHFEAVLASPVTL